MRTDDVWGSWPHNSLMVDLSLAVFLCRGLASSLLFDALEFVA